jgi:hypothetical protein
MARLSMKKKTNTKGTESSNLDTSKKGLDKNQASSKTAKYQVADQTNTPEFKKRF